MHLNNVKNKIDLTNSSWDKQTFLDDVRSTKQLIIDLMTAIPAEAESGVINLCDVGDTLRFLNFQYHIITIPYISQMELLKLSGAD